VSDTEGPSAGVAAVAWWCGTYTVTREESLGEQHGARRAVNGRETRDTVAERVP
jgi:hypothetical protein